MSKKIAVTVKENHENAKIDTRFGRCNFFAIYDKESGNIDFVANQATNTTSCASPMAIKLLNQHGVSSVISTEFGPKAQTTLKESQVEMIVLQNDQLTLKEIIKKIK